MERIVTYSFCEPFIDRLTEYIEKNYIRPGKDLSRLAIVFGGKRPALFIKRELARKMGKSFFPPQFFSIDEWIAYIVRKNGRFVPASDLESAYLLYTLAQKETPEILKGRKTFAQFLPWTREILAFIDQLDLERVSDDKLQHIEANAQIGYPVPEDVNRLLTHIIKLRRLYHKTVREKKVYSRGLQYLTAAETISNVRLDEFDQILFCNFFYFNRSEETVVKTLYDRGQATLIFQGDERRWPILKRLGDRMGFTIQEGETVVPPKFQLHLHAGFDTHSQVGIVREILKKTTNPEKTVIVLPHADHIIPLLSEIAEMVSDFNISMGYPLKRSSLYTLFEFVLGAQLSRKGHRYYAKDYLKTMRHPFVKNLRWDKDPTVTRMLIHKLEEILTGKEVTSLSGSLFVELEDVAGHDELYMEVLEVLDRLGIKSTREELRQIVEEIHDLLFERWEEATSFAKFSSALENFLTLFIQRSFLRNYPLNLDIAVRMLAIKDELGAVSFRDEDFPQEELFRIFDNKIAQEIVAFQGSPLKGLQILGLFETRSLNFDNVIVLDVNEGLLPRLNLYEPLIPREVMISLNLDRLELEEEIQRYQFLRLISSAKNVYLVYEESKEKERSRFIEELVWEEEKKYKETGVVPVIRGGFEVEMSSVKKCIKKTPAMIEALRRHTYSASALNMYIRNPMDFYRNYVLGLQEQEDLLDEPEARQVGTFVHELLEYAFMPYLKKKPEINAGFREKFSRIFEKRFEEAFGRSMKSDSFLLKTVMLERLNRFLDNEQSGEDRRVDKVLFLENRFEGTISLSVGDVRFAYIVDRIDQMESGEVMVVDYKTGSIDQMPKQIERIASMDLTRENLRDHLKSFQIPLYFYFMNKEFSGKKVNAALYNLRTLKFDRFIDDKMSYGPDQINDVFLKTIDFIISEILDPNVEFIDDPVSFGK